MPTVAKAYGNNFKTDPISPMTIQRRDPGPRDVQFKILFCGICHSDIHTARSEWPGTMYPCVPGHEIVGQVTAVGDQVKGFKVGDLAGVGCMVDSCQACESCKAGLEQYCDNNGIVFTYNSADPHFPGKSTYGGYSTHIVVDEKFCLHVPKNLELAGVAPLLCAGITLYSPLRHWNAGPGKTVGIVGLGGLGHMGVKLAHAMGARTVLFTTSPGKADDARRLGADEVVISKDAAAMAAQAGKFDLIVNTVAASHNLDPFIAALKRDGTMCLVGVPEHAHPSPSVMNMVFRRRNLAGSIIGGIKETQEMLDFCSAHNLVSDIELISIKQINQAYERVVKSDVKYRFVIDMATLE